MLLVNHHHSKFLIMKEDLVKHILDYATELEARLAASEARLAASEAHNVTLQQRLTASEARLTALEEQMASCFEQHADLESRLDELESHADFDFIEDEEPLVEEPEVSLAPDPTPAPAPAPAPAPIPPLEGESEGSALGGPAIPVDEGLSDLLAEITAPEPAPSPALEPAPAPVPAPASAPIPPLEGESEGSAPGGSVIPKISDIKQAISLGDRFLFQRELFKNNGEAYYKALQDLNALSSLEEAEAYIAKFGWNTESNAYQLFHNLLKRRW